MHNSMYSGYGLIPRKWECQPWHARSSHLTATQPILFEAYSKFRVAFFCSKLLFSRIAFKELEEK